VQSYSEESEAADMSTYLIGADVGTSGLKVVLVDASGPVLAVAERPYPMHRPQPSWAENDPEDWYRALVEGVHSVLATSGVEPAGVRALCIVAQRDPVALLDEDGQVLTPSINWTDRRDPDETERLFDDLGRDFLMDVSGVFPLSGLTLPNLVWTKRHLPDVWRRVRHALPPKDFLAYRLSGDIGTDVSTPSRSILSDWRTASWSQEICTRAGIPFEILPPVRYVPSDVRCELTDWAAGQLGLCPGTQLAVGGGDDQAATLACGVLDVGDVSIGTGSASAWRIVTDRGEVDPLGMADLTFHVVPDRFLYEMNINGTGTSFRWFRDTYGFSANHPDQPCSYDDLVAEAATVAPGADGLLFFPYVEGARQPYYDDAARGVFFGIEAGHTRAHFVRAIMEGIAFNYPPMLEIIGRHSSTIRSLTIVDGEARSDLWNSIKAHVTGRELRTIGHAEAAAMGAVILAGVATGTFATAAEGVATLVPPGKTFAPDPNLHDRYEIHRARWEAVRRRVFEAFHDGAAAAAQVQSQLDAIALARDTAISPVVAIPDEG
jgi:xylulokinase